MKEKQIEEMFNIIVDGVIDGEDNNGVPTGNTCANIAKSLHNAGYRKQNEGEWISVDERLPEDQQRVLTIDTEGEMQVCFYKTAWKGIFQMYHGLVKIFNITHWMPLPEAPKMKGGAE